jgi:hypothetical protein
MDAIGNGSSHPNLLEDVTTARYGRFTCGDLLAGGAKAGIGLASRWGLERSASDPKGHPGLRIRCPGLLRIVSRTWDG